MLIDLLVGCIVLFFIFLPNWLFKTKYSEDLDQMRASPDYEEPIEVDFSKDEIKELKQLERAFERRRRKKQTEMARE